MQSVSEWMHSNKLTLNASKTKVMTFGTSQKMRSNNNNLNVKVGNEILENVTEFKYLGVWFDKYLRWYTHIDQTATKISQRLGVIKRLSRYVDQCTHNTLYTALIQPHIDYCCTLWTHGANKYVNRIQILQNQVERLTFSTGSEMYMLVIYMLN